MKTIEQKGDCLLITEKQGRFFHSERMIFVNDQMSENDILALINRKTDFTNLTKTNMEIIKMFSRPIIVIFIKILEYAHGFLAWIFTKKLQEKRSDFDLRNSTINEIADHYGISYRQARKKWLTYHTETEEPKLKIMVNGQHHFPTPPMLFKTKRICG